MSENILERVVLHAGKAFMLAGESHTDSYIIQKGEVLAFTTQNGKKVEVGRYGPDSIIAESCLLLDSKLNVSYQALVDTTAVKVTRQDFEKKLTKLDKTLLNIVMMLVKKLKAHEEQDIEKALSAKLVDDKAKEIVDHLLRDMADDRKSRYEPILLPHFNIMVKALEDLRTKERHEKQRAELDKKVESMKYSAEEESEAETIA